MTKNTDGGTVLRQTDAKHNVMVFYILSPYKIEAQESCLQDFIADDLLMAIQSKDSKIATDEEGYVALCEAYPSYYKYEIAVRKSG